MICYVILAHQEFKNVEGLLSGIYHENNIYCICVNRNYVADALRLRSLCSRPNIHIISGPVTSWGMVLESYLHAIRFCLNYSDEWQSLMVLSGSDIPVKSQQGIMAIVANQEFAGRIVMDVRAHEADVDEDRVSTTRLLDKPFCDEGSPLFDVPLFNPFHHDFRSLEREEVAFVLRPGAVRAGWPRNRDTIANLTFQERDGNQRTIFFDHLPPIVRGALRHFFKDRPVAFGSVYGVYPRDFCEHCVSSEDGLNYSWLVRASFSAEETYFATMAHGPAFRDRVVPGSIMLSNPTYQQRLTQEFIKANMSAWNFFARKVPSPSLEGSFHREMYDDLGLPYDAELLAMPEAPSIGVVELWGALWQHLAVDNALFDFGALGGRYILQAGFTADGKIIYNEAGARELGDGWHFATDRLVITGWSVPFAEFRSARIVAGRLLLFGEWHHHPGVVLALSSDFDAIFNRLLKKAARRV